MGNVLSRNLIVEERGFGIKVVRFIRPDLRAELDEDGTIQESKLFRELLDGALGSLAAGEGLVLNLGLVEVFTSTFLCLLLRVRDLVGARGARLMLCRLHREHREVLEVTRTLQLFAITVSERDAVHKLTNG